MDNKDRLLVNKATNTAISIANMTDDVNIRDMALDIVDVLIGVSKRNDPERQVTEYTAEEMDKDFVTCPKSQAQQQIDKTKETLKHRMP